MKSLSDEDLHSRLTNLRITKTKLNKEAETCDTEMIGLKLEQDRRIEQSRQAIQASRDAQHGLLPFDE